VSATAGPVPGYEQIASADVNGNLRVWDLPASESRAIFQGSSTMYDLVFDPDSAAFTVSAFDGIVRRIRVADGHVDELRGHNGVVHRLAASDGRSVASWGEDHTVHVWRIGDGALLRVFAGQDQILDVGFLRAQGRYVSAGADGRLVAWSPTGSDETLLFKRPIWLRAVAVLGDRNRVVVADGDGAVWDVATGSGASAEPAASAHLVQPASRGGIEQLRASIDGRFVVVATAQGTVTVYDTTTWAVVASATARAGIMQIAVDPKSRDVAIATNDGRLQLLSIGAPRAWTWRDAPGPAKDLAYSADGEMLGFSCIDGGTWFYDRRTDRWAYARDHRADTISVLFSPDGKWFVSADRRGAVTLRDVAATFARAQP
jgi:WD40 repeat protein